MAKTIPAMKSRELMSKPRATPKRVRIAKSEVIVTPSRPMTCDADTAQRTGRAKSTKRMESMEDLTSLSSTTNRAGRKKAVKVTITKSKMPPTGTTKSASGKRTIISTQSKTALSTAGSDIADQTPSENQKVVVGRKGGKYASFDTQKSNIPALQFPNELLQDYKIYRQLQTALGRLNNQIKAIQKYDKSHGALLPLAEMHASGKRPYRETEKKIIAAVRLLPIWTWAKGVRGLAENSLGQILGETGDLSNYSNPAKLWKRMGLGLVNGHRQQFWAAGRKGFTRTENIAMATEMGYSARRRSLMHVVGSNLIRAKNVEYGALYRERKALEFTKLPDKDPLTGKKNKSKLSHAHKRAMRYMEKRLLLNLWKAWRGQPLEANLGDFATTPSTKKKGKAA